MGVKLLSLTLASFWLNLIGGQQSEKIPAIPLIEWQKAVIFAIPTDSDPKVAQIVKNYLQQLPTQENQAIWIQSEWAELANYQGTSSFSAASLTKVATTLAAVETWSLDHRFETRLYATGVISDGVLQGDLIIEGTGDPLFVWEEAIVLGNALNQMGIKQIKGNLIIIGNFSLNFKQDPQLSGELLKQALNAQKWTSEVERQYLTLPKGTAKPHISIEGDVQQQTQVPDNSQLLLIHHSLPLAELLKQMNIYSNNVMAEMLAQSLGGPQKIVQIITQTTKISPQEIQLINGSGLGVENRISPHAVCEMFMTLERKLTPQGTSVTDLFPVAGRDTKGTMQWRKLPQGIAIKTGTLNQVSALAGMISTKERGQVCFAIINSGSNIDKFRAQQDQLLQNLSQHWEIIPVTTTRTTTNTAFLGDPSRNIKNVIQVNQGNENE